MSTDLPALAEAFAGLKVVVLGDAILDCYLEGTSGRLSRAAPVPTVTLCRRSNVPGGAANTAVNVHILGGEVKFLTVFGDDAEGTALRHALHDAGVDTRHVLTRPGRHTIAKHRILAAAQLLLQLDQGDTGPLDAPTEATLARHLGQVAADADAVLVSDYGFGVLTPGIRETLADLQRSRPRILVVDSRHYLPAFRNANVTAVKPNFDEVVELLGAPELRDGRPRAAALLPHGEQILEMTGARIAAVTLDSDGALLFERGRRPWRTSAAPARHACAAGAGDTFASALTLARAAGADARAAGELAAAAAAVVVGKEGTAACSAQELQEYLCAEGKYVRHLERLAQRVEFYRQQGKRIVFTNGCFDILHRGHISYLHQARALGDLLIVGLNSDASIHRLKGPDRPINTLEDRIQVLAALSCIDHIIAFDDDTSCNLVRAVRPDVFVKGGDYTRERLPEAPLVEELGGVVRFLPYFSERSTSSLIERIKQAGEQLAPANAQPVPLETV
jgi:D-beta-D-heptose 7-phosphate kinase / D-beta-D-heptose 1-phosphate adenosyltransferase